MHGFVGETCEGLGSDFEDLVSFEFYEFYAFVGDVAVFGFVGAEWERFVVGEVGHGELCHDVTGWFWGQGDGGAKYSVICDL